MDELETAGFVAKDEGVNPETGKRGRIDRYRLRDNYTRFFLKYVSPRIPEIRSGTFRFHSVSLLPGWESMMGLQFENFVLNNLPVVLEFKGTHPAKHLKNKGLRKGGALSRRFCGVRVLIRV